MIDGGDIVVADLGHEKRERVIVISSARLHRVRGRALVAPVVPGPPDFVLDPWRCHAGDAVFAVDHVTTTTMDRLLEIVGRSTLSELRIMRAAAAMVIAG